MTSLFPVAADALEVDASVIHARNLDSAPVHSLLTANQNAAINQVQQWLRPWINARILGVKGDDTQNDSALAEALLQVAVNSGHNIFFEGTIRCDDGTTARRIVVDFSAATGSIYIAGDGSTVFKSHVTLDTADVALVDFVNTNPQQMPICQGYTVQGPGTFVNPNSTTKTATTSGTGTQITMTGAGALTGCIVTGTGIKNTGGGTYIRKVSGTTVTLSQALDGTGGAGTTVTIGMGDPRVGCGQRVASSATLTDVYAFGWYAGFLSTSEGSPTQALDHTNMKSCGAQENVIGHYFGDTLAGGTLDFKWDDFRVSRNQLAGIGCGPAGYIGSASISNSHFNAQPHSFVKLGTYGLASSDPSVGGTDLFIDGLVFFRTKFEGSANLVFCDQTGKATIRGIFVYVEPHGVEINGQKNKNSLTTYAANDHTLRDITISTMSRSGAGLVTATTAVALSTDFVGRALAVAATQANTVSGTGTVAASPSHDITGCVGFSAADVGRIIIGKGIPVNTIVGAYSAGTITLHDFTGANVNTTSAGNGSGPWTLVALTTSAWHGAYRIKTISGTTVTWDTGIAVSFGAEPGAAGLVGFMTCGTFRSSDIICDFQNDPSTAATFPERDFDIFDGYDVTIRPTDPDKIPINFPQMHVRSTTWDPTAANFVCKQGGITAWCGRSQNSATVAGTALMMLTNAGRYLDLHDGVKTTPYAGIAMNDIPAGTWGWVREPSGGFIDAGTIGNSGHGPGVVVSATASGVIATDTVVVIDAATANGKVRAWNGTTAGLVAVGWSTSPASGGYVAIKAQFFLTV